jgi:hypothetical protein
MKHKCGHFIVENTFGILEHPFQKLLEIFEIPIAIILDVFTCINWRYGWILTRRCYLMQLDHNLISMVVPKSFI